MNLFEVKVSSLRKNMLLSGVCKPISMIISYLYVPIVLNYLGIEKYGIWSTLLAIVSWISYFDIGIGNGLRNKLTIAIATKNGKEKKLISSAYFFISIIMLICLIVFSISAIFINWNTIFGVSDFEENLSSIVITCVFFVIINFVLSLCKNVLFALQKASVTSFMELFVQIFNFVGVLLAGAFFESNLFIITIIYGVSMLVVNIFTSICLYTKNPSLKPNIKSIDIEEGKNITNLGVQFFIIQICALVLFTTDNLIISRLYGAVSVTPYATVNKMYTAIIGVFSALVVPIWSNVTKAKSDNNILHLEKLLKKLNIIMTPFFIIAILLVFIFRPLMRFWLRQDLDYSTLLIVLGAIYCILQIWCTTYSSFVNGLELMKVAIITSVVQAILNIPMSIFFAEFYGMKTSGVLMGTVFSLFIAAIVFPIAVLRYIKQYQGKE